MDEISQEPKRGFRLPRGPRGWLVAVAIGGVVAASTVFAVTRGGGRVVANPRPVPSATAAASSQVVISEITPGPGATITPSLPTLAPVPTVAAAPGTVLMTCDTAIWGTLDPGWRAGSLRVGSLWLVGGRQSGYVRLGRARQAARATDSAMQLSPAQLLVHVEAGSPVVIRPAAGSRSYFQFLDDIGGGSYDALGDKGFTFVPCDPAEDTSPGSLTSFFNLGYALAPGRTASVEVWTSPSARPVWLTFSAPARPA